MRKHSRGVDEPNERLDIINTTHPARQCELDDCSVVHYAKGRCGRHYAAERRAKARAAAPPKLARMCTVNECDRKHASNGFCKVHWKRFAKHGTTDLVNPAKRRPAEFDADSDRFRCSVCGEVRSASDFHRNRSTWNGLSQWCKPCQKVDYRANRDRNLRTARSIRLSRYGMTADEYDVLLERQAGVCAICKSPPEGSKRLAIDHDHSCCPGTARSCGKCVRALLCTRCNPMLGYAKDDTARLLAAVDYLQSWARDNK